jgi:class 3 adenylate cyclase/tetratricopeptide (TPR) repeat protein
MDIGDWLRNLGLGQYEPAFRENEIDGEVLLTLTVEDLKELGVVALGHRRKILTAIMEVSGSAATPPTSAIRSPANSTTSLPIEVAERRQLTVMFCDLVGSTSMSARLDPEDMREVIRAYQDACSGAIARYDGFVAKFMGDGVLAYFGFPRAHEDDAERAARAGLDIVAAAAKQETASKDKLQVRIGIATGIVVVGDLVGQGSAQEQAVVGDTPNLAARLQALAEPGSVVIAEATRRLLGGTFELKPLGPQMVKGFETPVAAWTVLREAENVSRFEAARSVGMTPLIGREHEVSTLLDCWRDAAGGAGQVVLLSGEAGIGKSRVLEALRERIGDEPHVTVRYQCSPHHVNDAFYPMTAHIWKAAGFAGGEPAAARLDKLEALIERSRLETKEVAPFLAALLSIPFEGRYPALEMAPSEQKERTIAALITLFSGLTKRAPVLALLEDAHWIDPTALDLFGRLVNRLPGLRALLVLTFRPEFAAPWVGVANVTTLSLSRFGQRQAVAMVDRVTGGKTLPAEVPEQIVAKTDGVPLFVEELTKTVLDSGVLREENGAYVLAKALTPFAIPSTLQDSLMARLDRLAPAREIAQIGAVIGREFSYRLLEKVSPVQERPLQEALRQLMEAELIHGRGALPETVYAFKHALVQDTAYSSLLRSRRSRIHADIARALEERFADQIEAAPSIIAHHYTEAGLPERATPCWLEAAELALARSAPLEASRYIDAGLKLLPLCADNAERGSLELSLLVARANALFPLKGYAASVTMEALFAAKQLLDGGIGSDLQRFSVLFSLCSANYVAARMEPSLALAREMVQIALRQGDPIYRLVGYRQLGTVRLYMGDFREALEGLQSAEQYRDPVRQKQLSYRFAVDPGLAVLSFRMWTLLFLGLPDQAARTRAQLSAELQSHGHAPTVAMCSFFAVAWPELMFGDREAAARHCAELVAYCTENKVEHFRLLAFIIHRYAATMHEPTEENIAALRAAIDAKQQSGSLSMDSSFMFQLAQALMEMGDLTGAEATLEKAFAFVVRSGERFWLAELHRLDGQIALKLPEPDRARAETRFLKAIEIAFDQEARLLELRAATDLARLWRDTGSPNDPRALLEPVLAAIEGGESARDVRNARALLAEFA